jgi:hypothetical protein
MQRARIRHFVLIGLVVLAASSMLPSLGGGSNSKPAVVRTERSRYEATAKPAHARAAVPAALPRMDTWAER